TLPRNLVMRRSIIVTALVASLVALSAVSAHAQATPNRPAPPKGAPSDFVGMVSEDTFADFDSFVGDAARAGMTVLPILFHAPAFRARQSPTLTYPPTKYADLGDFGAVVVNR